jgi:hypothetical protein
LLHNPFRFRFGLARYSKIGYAFLIVTQSENGVKGKNMERAEKALKLPNQQFKRVIGTTKSVFQRMMTVLNAAYEKLHEPGGKPPDLSVGDKLLITLQYYREYRTMEHIGIDYGCSKSAVSRSVQWVENTLSADGQFQLPGKQALQDGDVKTVAVDVTEHPINRPKKNRKIGIPARKSGTQSSPRL